MIAGQLPDVQKAIRGEELDGWLFCNFHHRDRLADELLGIPEGAANSRLWIYAIPAEGGPLGILHVIEPDSLGDLPGKRVFYRNREELLARLAPLAGKRWGAHLSETLPVISYLDGGTAALLEGQGLDLVSAGGLIQRFRGLLDGADTAAHERAAAHLYEMVKIAWDRVREGRDGGRTPSEGEIRDLFLGEFERRGLIYDHPPIVAAGANSANPHYDFSGPGAAFREGDLVQFDLWAREKGPGGIYADISWAGFYGAEVPAPMAAAFQDLVGAREGAFRYIAEEMAAGRKLRGADVDRKTIEILSALGYAGAIRHRTGHGIDREVHGSGVNMDSAEFPDSRFLLEGSCFSLEPGIYFDGFGMRTEIDVYIKDGGPVISGGERQFALLDCAPRGQRA
ncbi:MAG: aminopeptidase P family protein [Treponema sp.]|jgi:Xaa-Pro aminopeptidase|nr:aminopeptidase P family protein [Treponema sp.]